MRLKAILFIALHLWVQGSCAQVHDQTSLTESDTTSSSTISESSSSPLASTSASSFPQGPLFPSRRVVFSDVFSFPKSSFVFGTTGVRKQDLKEKTLSDDVIVLPFSSRKYVCKVPTRETSLSNIDVYADRRSADAKRRATERAVLLVRPLKSKCLTHTQGWWTYEFCHMKNIIQYREYTAKSKSGTGEGTKKRLEYLLGKYDSSRHPQGFYGDKENAGTAGSELIEGEESGRRYLRMWYGNGQLCDGRPRIVEVQFSCCPTEHLSNVDEIAVCHYVIQVHTPKVCKDAVFRASLDKGAPLVSGGTEQIVCEPILDEEEYQRNLERRYISPDDVDDEEEEVVVTGSAVQKADTANTVSPVELRKRGCTDPTTCFPPIAPTPPKPPVNPSAAPQNLGLNDQDDDGGLEGGINTLLAGAAAAGTLPFQEPNALDPFEDDIYDYDDYEEDAGDTLVPNPPAPPGMMDDNLGMGGDSPLTSDTHEKTAEAKAAASKELFAREFAEGLEIELEDARIKIWELLKKKKGKDAEGKEVDGLQMERSGLLREELVKLVKMHGLDSKAAVVDDDDDDDDEEEEEDGTNDKENELFPY